jgi:hypothetical protein
LRRLGLPALPRSRSPQLTALAVRVSIVLIVAVIAFIRRVSAIANKLKSLREDQEKLLALTAREKDIEIAPHPSGVEGKGDASRISRNGVHDPQ